jgi:ribosomal-protein-alanine N-acetyltransferase
MSESASWTFPEQFPELQASRLRLRPLHADDTDALYAVFSDPRAMRYWSSPPMTEPAQAASYIEQIQRWFAGRGGIQWGIAHGDDDRVIGTVTLFLFTPEHRRCEVGFILHPDFWGRGLASEAVARALTWAFEDGAMERIEADVDPRNQPSQRLLEGLGFRREGLMRERWRVAGEIQDGLMLGLLRREFTSPATR